MLHEEALRIAQSRENKPGPASGAGAWLGRWKNQIGSEMNLAIAGQDRNVAVGHAIAIRVIPRPMYQ